MAARAEPTARKRSSYQYWRGTRVFVIEPITRSGLSQGTFAFPQANLKITKTSDVGLTFYVDGMKEPTTLKFENEFTAKKVYQFILKCTFGGTLNINKDGKPATREWNTTPMHFATLPFVDPRENTMVFDTYTGVLHIGSKSIRVYSLRIALLFEVVQESESEAAIVLTKPSTHECAGTEYARMGEGYVECRPEQFERLCAVMNNYYREIKEKLLLRNE